MPRSYTRKAIRDIKDVAPDFGLGDNQETRFANDDLETEQTGLSHHLLKPGKRQTFGHRHDEAEEIYFVISGSGRVKLDDEVVEVSERDAVRVSAGVTRSWEAGPSGLELLAFGPRRADDQGVILPGWWTD